MATRVSPGSPVWMFRMLQSTNTLVLEKRGSAAHPGVSRQEGLVESHWPNRVLYKSIEILTFVSKEVRNESNDAVTPQHSIALAA